MKKITITVLIICLLAGISYSAYEKFNVSEYTNKKKSVTEKTISKSTHDNILKATPVVQDINQPTIYEIMGSYANMTEDAKKSLDKWKAEVTEKVKSNPSLVFLNGEPTTKQVSLTFDDGPDMNITPRILDILKQHNVHGNFFFIGENIERNPSTVIRAYNEGNLVLNHSLNHPNFYNKDVNFIDNQLNKTDDYIKHLIGVTPALVRPPYGIVTDNLINAAKEKGDKLVIWSTDTYDWAKKDKNSITKNVLDNVRPGEIILMHSNGDKHATAEALPDIIDGLQRKGYKIVTLDKLLNVNAYK